MLRIAKTKNGNRKEKKIVWDKKWKIMVWKGIYVVYERKLLKQIYDILNVKLFKINLKQCRSITPSYPL